MSMKQPFPRIWPLAGPPALSSAVAKLFFTRAILCPSVSQNTQGLSGQYRSLKRILDSNAA